MYVRGKSGRNVEIINIPKAVYRLELEWRSLKDCDGIVFGSTDQTERSSWLKIDGAHWTTLARQTSIACASVKEENVSESKNTSLKKENVGKNYFSRASPTAATKKSCDRYNYVMFKKIACK